MSQIPIFDGSGDVMIWKAQVKAKLVAKGYKKTLVASQRAEPVREWDLLAEKATGIILTYLDPSIVDLFEAHASPEPLFNAIEAHYKLDERQAIDRLEGEFMSLTYDGSDPVVWVARVRGLLAKLTAKKAAPADRTVRTLVLKAL